ncbi:MAG: AMP-binding protein, partial [Proteobacteria bacterium]|nr:AMP-binding protein [Pseudomonadota bacterium]
MATRKKRPAAARAKTAKRPARPAAAKAASRKAPPPRRPKPLPESLASIRIAVTTIGDLLLTAADRYPADDAVVMPHRKLTYAQLARRAMECARELQALGVKSRDHVGLLLPSCMEFVEYMFGAALCGAVVVPINARYKPAELSYVIENGDLVTIVTTGDVPDQVDFVARLHAALPSLARQPDPRALDLAEAPKLRNIVLLGKRTDRGCVAAKQLPALARAVPVDEVHRARLRARVRDAALMLYTSGTTANPKGCLITHEAMVRNSIALGR